MYLFSAAPAADFVRLFSVVTLTLLGAQFSCPTWLLAKARVVMDDGSDSESSTSRRCKLCAGSPSMLLQNSCSDGHLRKTSQQVPLVRAILAWRRGKRVKRGLFLDAKLWFGTPCLPPRLFCVPLVVPVCVSKGKIFKFSKKKSAKKSRQEGCVRTTICRVLQVQKKP